MEYTIVIGFELGNTIYSEHHCLLVGRLRQSRKTMALSQMDVAKLLGRSQSYVSKLESGQHRITVAQLRELAKIYSKDVSYFITD